MGGRQVAHPPAGDALTDRWLVLDRPAGLRLDQPVGCAWAGQSATGQPAVSGPAGGVVPACCVGLVGGFRLSGRAGPPVIRPLVRRWRAACGLAGGVRLDRMAASGPADSLRGPADSLRVDGPANCVWTGRRTGSGPVGAGLVQSRSVPVGAGTGWRWLVLSGVVLRVSQRWGAGSRRQWISELWVVRPGRRLVARAWTGVLSESKRG